MNNKGSRINLCEIPDGTDAVVKHKTMQNYYLASIVI